MYILFGRNAVIIITKKAMLESIKFFVFFNYYIPPKIYLDYLRVILFRIRQSLIQLSHYFRRIFVATVSKRVNLDNRAIHNNFIGLPVTYCFYPNTCSGRC